MATGYFFARIGPLDKAEIQLRKARQWAAESRAAAITVMLPMIEATV